jgi:hypothetical protein
MTELSPEDEAPDYFRKLVSFLYREIGAMRRENHPAIFDRSTLASSGFAADRKQQAKRIYFQTVSSMDVAQVVAPYRAKTGLSLQDVRDAFRDGDWLLGARRYSFGGPNWARIADATLELGRAISDKRRDAAQHLIAEINVLCHNNGRIVDKFNELVQHGE